MLFYLKRSFEALTPSIFLPLYTKALEKVQKLALKFVNVLRYDLYEASLQQLRLFPLTHRESVVIFYPCSRLPMAFWSFPFNPARSYTATPTSSTNRDVLPAAANTLSPFRLSYFGINYRLR